MVLIEGCLIMCILGCLLLFGIGLALIDEYQYIPLQNITLHDAGMTCLMAAGIYLLILVIILIKYKRNKSWPDPLNDNESDSSDEDAPFIKEYGKKKS
jgi:TRAP-type C4-dicarboxylate transport system permease small subunit